MRALSLKQANGLKLFRPWPGERLFKWIDNQIRQAKCQQGAEDECTSPKTAENNQRDSNDDKNWGPHSCVTDERHEEVEGRMRPFLVD